MPSSSHHAMARCAIMAVVLLGTFVYTAHCFPRMASITAGKLQRRSLSAPPHGATVVPERHQPSSRTNTNKRPTVFVTRGNNKRQRHYETTKEKWRQAERVERQLLQALEQGSYFPSTRDCNAALATFGDGGDLLRALRLFGKMRKVATRASPSSPSPCSLPTPTLVTYSTIMSRANKLGKPLVALRLWKLMRGQGDFFSNSNAAKSHHCHLITPDVRAANILMNAHAKLGDVIAASNVLEQMNGGNGLDVPKLKPNVVTYNTLLDACRVAGDLQQALAYKEQLIESGLTPDANTYTTLIATVARKSSSVSGLNDPTMAFSLHQEMISKHIVPNGVTYSALIDVCGRCQRSDLALKGLRIMLDQKAADVTSGTTTLMAEVGAWTAAINACGKAGRIETALKLFYTMSKNFGVQPNTVTCGCLTDCLLRHGRTADTLRVLRYMKEYGIPTSEVMYTSLMTSAGRLVQYENSQAKETNSQITDPLPLLPIPPRPSMAPRRSSSSRPEDVFPVDDSGQAKAIEVYTALIHSLTNAKEHPQSLSKQRKKNSFSHNKQPEDAGQKELMRVFLVFAEMKSAGAQPDLACYHALLRACANAGALHRARMVLQDILSSSVHPTDQTWTEVIRAAGKAGRTDVALATWKQALAWQTAGSTDRWRPTPKSVAALFTALLRAATSDESMDDHTRKGIYNLIVQSYQSMVADTNVSVSSMRAGDMGMHLVDKAAVESDARLMLLCLQAIVALADNNDNDNSSSALRSLAVSIVSLDCLADGLPFGMRQYAAIRQAYQVGRSWAMRTDQAAPLKLP